MRSLPVCSVEDEEFRRFEQATAVMGTKKLIEIINCLVRLFEKQVAMELAGTSDAVMYDCWTANSTHFVSLFALYCATTQKKMKTAFITE